MYSPELQQRITQTYYSMAQGFEDQRGIGVSDRAATSVWTQDLCRLVAPAQDGQVALDVGTATGSLAHLLAGWGYSVYGIDPSDALIARGIARLSAEERARIHLAVGDTHQRDLFPAATFDLVISSQVVCLLADPLVAFGNWHTWLKPHGTVVVIDGLWSRAGFGDDALADQLPLSCVQTRATLAYLLQKSQFAITQMGWMEYVNAYYAQQADSALRYVIVAGKV